MGNNDTLLKGETVTKAQLALKQLGQMEKAQARLDQTKLEFHKLYIGFNASDLAELGGLLGGDAIRDTLPSPGDEWGIDRFIADAFARKAKR